MQHTTTTVAFKKLRNGEWGISGPADQIAAGRTVTVTKRSGQTSTVTVRRTLWTDGATSVASIGTEPVKTRRPKSTCCEDAEDMGWPCRFHGRNYQS